MGKKKKRKMGSELKIRDFRNLKVWNRAICFAVEIYKVTGDFPRREIYSLVDQIRRASVSIFSNIAEGCKRGTDKELVRFCNMALGSTGEIEAQLIFAGMVGYLRGDVVDKLVKEADELGRMLMGLVKIVKKRVEGEDG